MRDSDVEGSVRSVGSRVEPDDVEEEICNFTDEQRAEAEEAPDKAVMDLPPMLNALSTACIIANRMVGTGIWLTPTLLAQGTRSVGVSLTFWAIGGVAAVCGAHVFAEYGLSVPMLPIPGKGDQFVPRNGGEKNYIEFFYKKPRLLATCIYGVPFAIMGNVAGNTLIFAESVLEAKNGEAANTWAVRGVAIAVATFACTLHAVWRKLGIVINDAFGILKAVMLLVVFSLGVAYLGGSFGGQSETAATNMALSNSTADASHSTYGYAQAYLGVLFALGGFHQANYVLGEVKAPKRHFKLTTLLTVTCIATLYFLVNLAYMFVVPSEVQYQTRDPKDTVAHAFFRILFGNSNASKVQFSLMAFTSFGNIIVQTYTAARVKQEIAKEGIIPFAGFFAKNYAITPEFLRSKKDKGSEATPAAAYLLHWIFAIILILATVPAKDKSYRILVNSYSLIINAIFGCLVGTSLLMLRFDKRYEWTQKSSSNAWLSVGTASIYTIANLFPLIAIWIRPTTDRDLNLLGKEIPWYTIGVIATSVMAFAFVWWLAIRFIVPRWKKGELTPERDYGFVYRYDTWIVKSEISRITWKPRWKEA